MFKFLIEPSFKERKNFIPQIAYCIDQEDGEWGNDMRANISFIDYYSLLPQNNDGKNFLTLLDEFVATGKETAPNKEDYLMCYRVGLAKKLKEMNIKEHIELSAPIRHQQDIEAGHNFLTRQVYLQDAPRMTLSEYNKIFNDAKILNNDFENIQEERYFVEFFNDRPRNKNLQFPNPAKTLIFGTEAIVNYQAYRASKYHGFSLMMEVKDQIELSIDCESPKGTYTTFDSMKGPEGLFNALQMSSFEHFETRMVDTDEADKIADALRLLRQETGVLLNPYKQALKAKAIFLKAQA